MTLVTGASATQDVTANINHYHSGYQRQGRLQRKSSLTGGPRVLGLENLPDNHRFSAGPAAEDELPHLGAMMARHIPGLRASQAAFEEVHRYSQSILSIRGKSGLAGCFAALLLNSEGLARLLASRRASSFAAGPARGGRRRDLYLGTLLSRTGGRGSSPHHAVAQPAVVCWRRHLCPRGNGARGGIPRPDRILSPRGR